jgi:hypothetical protein
MSAVNDRKLLPVATFPSLKLVQISRIAHTIHTLVVEVL